MMSISLNRIESRAILRRSLENDSPSSLRRVVEDLSSRLGQGRWESFLGELVYHLCIEIMLESSERAYFLVSRIFDQVLVGELEGLFANASLGCLCKSELLVPSLVAKLVSMSETEPFTAISEWVCGCGSGCSLGSRLCVGKSAFELGIMSFNYKAIDKILEGPKKLTDLDYRLLVPLFRKGDGVARSSTIGVLHRYYPVENQSVCYAAAELIAVLKDVREGRIGGFPVEHVGALGRRAREILGDLVDKNRSILLIVAETGALVPGRDVIFRFLIDMKVNPPPNLLEDLIVSNPDFWVSQNTATDSCPANAFAWGAAVHLSSKFFRSCSHILSYYTTCQCPPCHRWRSTQSCSIDRLRVWLDTVTRGEWGLGKHAGFQLLETLKARGDVDGWQGADLSVSDAQGNTVLHLAGNINLISDAVSQGIDVNLKNNGGRTPLECAIVECDVAKIRFLISHAHAQLTSFCIERLCGLMDGNPSLLSCIKAAAQDLNLEKPKPSLVAEIGKLQHRLVSDRISGKRKLERIEAKHSCQLDELKAEMNAKIEQLELEKSKLNRQIDKMRANALEEETRECSVCMETRWDTALLCGHCFCFSCANAVCKQLCPICSQPSSPSQFIRLFNCK